MTMSPNASSPYTRYVIADLGIDACSPQPKQPEYETAAVTILLPCRWSVPFHPTVYTVLLLDGEQRLFTISNVRRGQREGDTF
jgi:hypothetical protein